MNKKIVYLLYSFLLLGLVILTGRLFWLTGVKGNYYHQLADENRIRLIKKPAPRGIIYDRKGRVLARNVPVFKKVQRFKGLKVQSNEEEEWEIISREEALKLEAGGKEVEIKTVIGREYPYEEVLAHVIGYLGEVTEDELKTDRLQGNAKALKLGDIVGRTGIEETYDSWLRGIDGGELVEVDTEGKVIKKIGEKEPVAGQNLSLSIDAQLQKIAHQALEGKKGAVVASHPETGEVLTLVSSPSFDSNIFEEVQRYKGTEVQSGQNEAEKILNDPNQPLFNRAISGLYPPGSTFKIITATAGLEEEKINRNFEIDDPGIIFVGPYKYANWYYTQYGQKEGPVDIVKAIQRSTDTFFYKVGEMVGIKALKDWAQNFGLGQISGIDLAGEAVGLMPSPEWKEKEKGEPWFLGNTYHVSIGQGDILTTPLQVNMWTVVIANGGKLCRPQLLKNPKSEILNPKQILPQSGIPLRGINSKFKILNYECKDLSLKPETLSLIQEGMERACASGGTGWPLFDFNPPVACKTGTAEYGDPEDKTHASITVYAPTFAKATAGKPASNPEIVVTVLVEGGGEGSSVAGPIAKKILEEWFRK